MIARHVELIVTIADAGTLAAAAVRLNKSQPAISKALQSAERDIGCRIFQRHAHGVVPTTEGQSIVERCRMVHRELERMADDVNRSDAGFGGTLNLIVSPVAAVHILPPVLRRFSNRFPGVQVQVTGGHSNKAFHMLRKREADFVIGPAPEAGEDAGLRSVNLMSNGITFVTGAQSKYAGETDPKVLQGARWLLIGPRERRPLYTDFFVAHGLTPPRPAVCSDSILTLFSLLESSDVVCSIPSLLLPMVQARWRLATLPVALDGPIIQIALTMLAGRIPTNAEVAFEDVLVEEVARSPVLT